MRGKMALRPRKGERNVPVASQRENPAFLSLRTEGERIVPVLRTEGERNVPVLRTEGGPATVQLFLWIEY